MNDVTFKNVTITGAPGEYLVQLEGASPEHDVHKVAFDNVVILNQPLSRDSKRLQIGGNVKEVSFGSTAKQ